MNAATLDLTGVSAAPITIKVNGMALTNVDGANSTFTLLTTTGGITGFSADQFVINSSGLTAGTGASWSVKESGNDLVLNYAGAPPANGPVRPDSGQGTSN